MQVQPHLRLRAARMTTFAAGAPGDRVGVWLLLGGGFGKSFQFHERPMALELAALFGEGGHVETERIECTRAHGDEV
jgi:hypothetical protein